MATNDANLRDANFRIKQAREKLAQIPYLDELMPVYYADLMEDKLREIKRELEQAIARLQDYNGPCPR